VLYNTTGELYFSAQKGSPSCTVCPAGAVCELDNESLYSGYSSKEGYYLLPSDEVAEFWSDSEIDLVLGNLYKCPHGNGLACEGYNKCIQHDGDDRPAMEGPLCGTCAEGYARSDAFTVCGKCPSVGKAILHSMTNIILLGATAIGLGMLVATADPKEVKGKASVIFKIFMNYLHLSMVVLPITMSGNSLLADHFVELLELPQYLFGSKGVSSSGLAADCLLQYMIPGLEAYQLTTLLGLFIIPMWLLFDVVVFGIMRLLKRKKPPGGDFLLIIVVVNVFVVYPRAIQLLLVPMECRYFDKGRLMYDLSVACDEEEHNLWFAIGAVGFVIYALGTPFFTFMLLRRYSIQRQLCEPRVIRMLGFLYKGFEPRFYYFECVFMLRKVLFQACVLMPGLGAVSTFTHSAIQSCCLLMMSIMFLGLHLMCKPYDNRDLQLFDRAEMAMLWATVVSCLMKTWQFVTMYAWAFDMSENYTKARDLVCLLVVMAFHFRFYFVCVWAFIGKPVTEHKRCKCLAPRQTVTVLKDQMGLDTKDLDAAHKEFLLQTLQELSSLLVEENGDFSPQNYADMVELLVTNAYKRNLLKKRLKEKLGKAQKLYPLLRQVRATIRFLPICIQETRAVMLISNYCKEKTTLPGHNDKGDSVVSGTFIAASSTSILKGDTVFQEDEEDEEEEEDMDPSELYGAQCTVPDLYEALLSIQLRFKKIHRQQFLENNLIRSGARRSETPSDEPTTSVDSLGNNVFRVANALRPRPADRPRSPFQPQPTSTMSTPSDASDCRRGVHQAWTRQQENGILQRVRQVSSQSSHKAQLRAASLPSPLSKDAPRPPQVKESASASSSAIGVLPAGSVDHMGFEETRSSPGTEELPSESGEDVAAKLQKALQLIKAKDEEISRLKGGTPGLSELVAEVKTA